MFNAFNIFNIFQVNCKDIRATSDDVILLSSLLTWDICSKTFRISMQCFEKKSLNRHLTTKKNKISSVISPIYSNSVHIRNDLEIKMSVVQARGVYETNKTWLSLSYLMKSKCPNYRDTSSRLEVFCKKGVLGNFAKFTRKHLCQRL